MPEHPTADSEEILEFVCCVWRIIPILASKQMLWSDDRTYCNWWSAKIKPGSHLQGQQDMSRGPRSCPETHWQAGSRWSGTWTKMPSQPSIFWKDRLQAAYWLQMYLLPIAHHYFRVMLLYLKIFKIFFLDTFLSYNFLVGMTFSFKPGSLPFTLQDKILISLLGTFLEGS